MSQQRSYSMAFVAALVALLLAGPVRVQAQQTGQITGQVVSAADQAPLAGVQVLVEGTGIGTITDNSGRYLLINVPVGTVTVQAILLGRSTEERTATIVAGGTVELNFELRQDAIALDEIVVTGVPGGTRKRAIGNAVGEVDAAAIVDAAPVANVQQVMGARVPSVNMMQMGVVGGAPRIRIRGASSFALTGAPLIYIDGVRVSRDEVTGWMYGNASGVRAMLSTLDPAQIERIEVLKGPAAATLYGTQASRGVINIITKQGNAGPAQVSAMVRTGFNFTANPIENIAFENYWTDPVTGEVKSVNMIEHLHNQGRHLFTYGPIQMYSVNVSGGSDDTRYYIASSYSSEEGILNTNWKKQFNARANLDSQLNDNLGVSVRLGYSRSSDRIPTDGYGSSVEGIQHGSPRYLPENRCAPNPFPGCDLLNGFPSHTVPAAQRSRHNNTKLDRVTGGLTFNYEAFGWLTSRLILGIDYISERNIAYRLFQTNVEFPRFRGQ